MTLPPEKIGDKGQRWVVQCLGYPMDGWYPVGYSHYKAGARQMAAAIIQAPRARATRLYDRETRGYCERRDKR